MKSLLFIVGTIVIPHHGCCYFGSTSVAIKAGHSATSGTYYPEIVLLHCAYSLTLLAGPEPASTGFAERLVYRHREMCAHMPVHSQHGHFFTCLGGAGKLDGFHPQ